MKFLSTEWFGAFSDALATVAPAAVPAQQVGVGQLITGSPNGEASYTVMVGGNLPASVLDGSLEAAMVTLVTDYTTACAIAQGVSTADLLYQGAIKVRGDVEALLGAQEALASLSDALTDLSSKTEFDN